MVSAESGETQVVLTGLDVPLASIERPPSRRSLSFGRFRYWADSCHRIFRRASSSASSELYVFQQAAKLVEEVGELHAALLASQGLQRAGKCEAAIESELADVVICAAILASALNINLEVATLSKMETVNQRMSQTG